MFFCFCFHFRKKQRGTVVLVNTMVILHGGLNTCHNWNSVSSDHRVKIVFVVKYQTVHHLRSDPPTALMCHDATSTGFLGVTDSSERVRQLAMSVHNWCWTLVGLILRNIQYSWSVFVKQKQIIPTSHPLLVSVLRSEPRDSWKLCCGKGTAAWQSSTVRQTLLGIHAWKCRKLYVISLTVELLYFSFV